MLVQARQRKFNGYMSCTFPYDAVKFLCTFPLVQDSSLRTAIVHAYRAHLVYLHHWKSQISCLKKLQEIYKKFSMKNL